MMRYNVDVKEKALLDLKKLKFHEPKAAHSDDVFLPHIEKPNLSQASLAVL